MIDNSIRETLSKLDGNYKFNDLLTFMEDSGITFYDRGLNNALGLTTLDGIYLDLSMMRYFGDRLTFFIILHEIAHYKRIARYGGNWLIEKLSVADYETFLNGIYEEEIIADRYACQMFYRLNRDIYLWKHTQQLNLVENQEKYQVAANTYYGKIQNDETKYRLLIEQFIK